MTRELKLALIVGFGLVLLVSFLIADHLSASRKVALDAKVEEQPAVIGAPVAPPEPVVTITQGRSSGLTSVPVQTSAAPAAPVVDARTGETILDSAQATSSDVIATVGTRVGEVLNGERQLPPAASTSSVPLGANGIVTISQQQLAGIDTLRGNQARSTSADTTSQTLADAARVRTSTAADVVPFGIGSQAATSPTPAPVSPTTGLASNPGETTNRSSGTTPPREAGRIESAGEDRWHTIASGESLFSIAKRYYGKGEHWKMLADYNKDRVNKGGQVRVGVRLRIPTAQKLGIPGASAPSVGRNTPEDPAARQPQSSASRTPQRSTETAKPAGSGSARTYVVKKGDTLSTISQRELGTIKRMDEVMRLNNIKDASQIRIGMELKLPAQS